MSGNTLTAHHADILYGKREPGGKLPVTFPIKYEDTPAFPNFAQEHDDALYGEGIYVGYRFYEKAHRLVKYPFGYGLSYTTFKIDYQTINHEKSVMNINVQVTNTGDVSGKEVVQVYITPPQGLLDKPYQNLVSFQKTKLLAPKESQTLRLTFDLKDMASYDEKQSKYLLEKGN